jgi:hypothetical protein
MAVAVIQAVRNGGTGTDLNPITLNNVVAGSTLMLVVACANVDAPTMSDSGGQNWGPAKVSFVATTDTKNVVFILDNANAGTHTITMGQTLNFYHGKCLVELKGCLNPSFDAASLGTRFNKATPTITVNNAALSQADEALFSFMTTDMGGQVVNTETTGFTPIMSEPDNDNLYGYGLAFKNVNSKKIDSSTWNCTGTGTMGAVLFGLRTTPPPVKNAGGLRRWLIQYYSDYFAKRDKEKELEKLSQEMVNQASAGVISEKKHMPITERVIESKPDMQAVRRNVELQLQRSYLNKQLAEYTGNQAIISQVSQLADESIGLRSRLDGEQADEDFLLLASVL